jgi:hypothetical protein
MTDQHALRSLVEKIARVARSRAQAATAATGAQSFPQAKVDRILGKVQARIAGAGCTEATTSDRSDTMFRRKPLLIQFTELLHECDDGNAPAVKEFLKKHEGDKTFLERAQVVLNSYQMKKDFEKLMSKDVI